MAAAVSVEHFDNLQLLLKAPSKDAVKDVCVQSHRRVSEGVMKTTAETLKISREEAEKLVRSLHVLSHHVLFYNLGSPEQILLLFPDSFHSSLKNLITKDPAGEQPDVENPSPQRADLAPPAEGGGLESRHGNRLRLSQPDVRPDRPGSAQDRGPEPLAGGEPVSTVTVELSRESLDPILEGLARIRDQLSVVAGT